MRIALVLTLLVLAAHPTAAQGRRTQVVTGISLASLGVYAAAMDRDCDVHPQTTLVAGSCEWRAARGVIAGVPPELPRDQLAAGLTAAAIGGLMVGGAWEPSKAVDSIFTAGAGFLMLATSWDATWVRDTVHVDAGDGRRLTTCPDPRHWSYSWMTRDYDKGLDSGCRHESFSRIHMMWSGFAALGLAAGRALWRDEPPLTVDLRPGGIWVGKTISF